MISTTVFSLLKRIKIFHLFRICFQVFDLAEKTNKLTNLKKSLISSKNHILSPAGLFRLDRSTTCILVRILTEHPNSGSDSELDGDYCISSQ